MSGMIIVGAFTLGGFFLGAIVTLLGVIASRPPEKKEDVDTVVNGYVNDMPMFDRRDIHDAVKKADIK